MYIGGTRRSSNDGKLCVRFKHVTRYITELVRSRIAMVTSAFMRYFVVFLKTDACVFDIQ